MTKKDFKNGKAVLSNVARMFMAVLIIGLAVVSCDKKNDPKDLDDLEDLALEGFAVKKGTIAYKHTSWADSETDEQTYTLTFDDNGKRSRLQTSDNEVVIHDAVTGKMYLLDTGNKQYTESAHSNYSAIAAYIYLGDDAGSLWSYYPGFKKESNKTIAGQNCSVCSWSDGEDKVEWGGWKRITFWMQAGTPGTDGCVRMEAVSFSENIPENSFTPPSDYTKVSY